MTPYLIWAQATLEELVNKDLLIVVELDKLVLVDCYALLGAYIDEV
jgi:hypothetical protein